MVIQHKCSKKLPIVLSDFCGSTVATTSTNCFFHVIGILSASSTSYVCWCTIFLSFTGSSFGHYDSPLSSIFGSYFLATLGGGLIIITLSPRKMIVPRLLFSPSSIISSASSRVKLRWAS